MMEDEKKKSKREGSRWPAFPAGPTSEFSKV